MRLTSAAHLTQRSLASSEAVGAALFHLLGFPAQGLLGVLGCLGQLALLSECPRQVSVGFGEVGLDAERLPEMLDRLRMLALKGEHPAPVAVGEGKVRLDAQRLLQMFDRLGQLPLTIEPLVDRLEKSRLHSQAREKLLDQLGL